MTDTSLLRKTISESGLKFSFIAEQLGLSRFGLMKKIDGDTEFKASEIAKLSDILKIDNKNRDRIFFA